MQILDSCRVFCEGSGLQFLAITRRILILGDLLNDMPGGYPVVMKDKGTGRYPGFILRVSALPGRPSKTQSPEMYYLRRSHEFLENSGKSF